MTSFLYLRVAAASLFIGYGVAANIPAPPPTDKIPVSETIDGVTITDNYRWLEDQNSPQTRAWITAEQKYTKEFFDSIGTRDEIRKSLEPLERVEHVSLPVVANGRYFFERRGPDEQQASIYVRQGPTGPDQVLVNPNVLFPDHSGSVLISDVSRDGKILAYEIRKGGADETEVHFLDVDAKKDLPDTLAAARNTFWRGYGFTPDNSTVYYSRYEAAGPRVYRHRMGSPATEDQEIFGEDYGPGYFASCGVTGTAKYLFCRFNKGAAGVESDIYLQNLRQEKTLRPIAMHVPTVLETEPYQDHMFVLLARDAPNRKIMDIDLDHPAPNQWKQVIPQGKTAISTFSVASNKLYVVTLENAAERCRAYRTDGTAIGPVALPAMGSVEGISGEEGGTDAFIEFSSFADPPTIFRIANHATSTWWRANVPVPAADIAVEQVWYPSKDGTKIPMFVARKKGQPSGPRPALLTGYGGFNIPLTPRWSAVTAWWVEQGGLFAVPSLRGGGEFGEAWHRAGMFEQKQNVFDDFIGAAEYLIRSGITSRDRLAIYGTSNGGLLVGAVMTQRPDLFRAVVCGAPLLDMVRYQNFKIARAWVSEYGSSEDPNQFRYILKYSPYQHVEKGASYPAVMFWTGDSDTRVDPLHARKMAAEMQAEAAPGRPVIIRYDTLTGHSGGRSVDQELDFDADFFAFLKSQVG